jgi:hypothetical protein
MKPAAQEAPRSPFLNAFHGSLRSALKWHDLDTLWDTLRAQAARGWYVYAIGETPPQSPAPVDKFTQFITEVDALLRREHEEDYCAIVYADDFATPSLVKIYDPNNLGVQCGFSDNPPLPGWVLSVHPPEDLPALRQAAGRRRWWQRIFE